jgi:hypothetical protein
METGVPSPLFLPLLTEHCTADICTRRKTTQMLLQRGREGGRESEIIGDAKGDGGDGAVT